MPLFYVDNVGRPGLVSDTAAHQLPPGAWSDGKNIRFRDGYCENVGGHSSLVTPQVAPYNLFPVIYTGYTYWLYMGLKKARVYDFAADFDITRAGADYSVAEGRRWTGGMFNGVFILNNFAEIPQMWSPINHTQKLQNLTNWPSNVRARALRPFKNFIIAAGIQKGARFYGQRIKWSHPAAPGNVPSSWDETDFTNDAGEEDLALTSDLCVDMLPLGALNVVYKEDSTWLMRHVGGSRIFDTKLRWATTGALGIGCAQEVMGQHLVLGQDDLVLHDGTNIRSILDGRRRRWLFNLISKQYAGRSFIAVNEAQKEAWVCFPSGSSQWPNEVLIWNYAEDTLGHRELPAGTTDIAFGQTEHIGDGLLKWNDLGTDPGDKWEIPPGTLTGSLIANKPWDTVTKPRTNFGLVLATTAPGLYVADSGATFAGSTYTSRTERLALVKPRANDEGMDFNLDAYGLITEVWPVITADSGASINIYVASQKVVGGAVAWSGPFAYNPETDFKIDCQVSGRFLGLRFQTTTAVRWKLFGYAVRVEKGGLYQ